MTRTEAPGRHLGHTPLKGAKLPNLIEITKAAGFEAVTINSPDGRSRTAHVHEQSRSSDARKPHRGAVVAADVDPAARCNGARMRRTLVA